MMRTVKSGIAPANFAIRAIMVRGDTGRGLSVRILRAQAFSFATVLPLLLSQVQPFDIESGVLAEEMIHAIAPAFDVFAGAEHLAFAFIVIGVAPGTQLLVVARLAVSFTVITP